MRLLKFRNKQTIYRDENQILNRISDFYFSLKEIIKPYKSRMRKYLILKNKEMV